MSLLLIDSAKVRRKIHITKYLWLIDVKTERQIVIWIVCQDNIIVSAEDIASSILSSSIVNVHVFSP